MKQQIAIPVRLIAVALFHIALAYFLFEAFYGSTGKHFYFPMGFTLIEVSVCLFCIVALVPVLLRGDFVERTMAIMLAVLPLMVLAFGLRSIIRVFSYAYA
jgi:hypothetical protein